jgi:membrane-associated protein
MTCRTEGGRYPRRVVNDLQNVLLLNGLLDPNAWIDRFGAFALWGVALIIFIECWLFPFLPGDSLLFVVGLLISQNEKVTVPIWLACLVLSAAAVLSNVVGYLVGARIGSALFNRPDSRFFKQEYVDKTYAFFDRYGNRAIVLARFVPIVRTFITLAAGVGRMSMRRFVAYSAIGGVLWASGVTLLGYWLGQVAFLSDHIDLVLVGVVAISLIPILLEFMRARSRQRDPRYDEQSEREAVLRRQADDED